MVKKDVIPRPPGAFASEEGARPAREGGETECPMGERAEQFAPGAEEGKRRGAEGGGPE